MARHAMVASLFLVTLWTSSPTLAAQGLADPSRLRIEPAWVENLGSFPSEVRFLAWSPEVTWLVGDGWFGARFVGERSTGAGELADLTFRVGGETSATRITPGEPAPGVMNFFLGRDPARWTRGARRYQRLRMDGFAPGVTLVLHVTDRGLQYDVVVESPAASCDPSLECSGQDSANQREDGTLALSCSAGEIRQRPAVAYAGTPSGRLPMTCRSEWSSGSLRLIVDQAADALVIDPMLEASTFLGGETGTDTALRTVASGGSVYLCGQTWSLDFPVTPGAYDESINNSGDGFVAKFSEGKLEYATYLGGTKSDSPIGIDAGLDGSIYIAGGTQSPDFPVTPGCMDPAQNGPFPDQDGFLTRLDPSGSTLVYSTYVGGYLGEDFAAAVAVDDAGYAYVTGQASAHDFPVTAGAHDTIVESKDVFVLKMNPSGSGLVYGTLIGGISHQGPAWDIAIDTAGAAYICGVTDQYYPVTPGAFDTTFGGFGDSFVTKVDPTGSTLAYSTFIGGSDLDWGRGGIDVDESGSVYHTGWTYSNDFPVNPGGADTTWNGNNDAYVLQLNASGSALVFSTFLGGGGRDEGQDILVDPVSAKVLVCGRTDSFNFPVTSDAFDGTPNGKYDAFVTLLDSAGSSILYSTFCGGMEYEYARSMTWNEAARVTLVGETNSSDFPITPGAFDSTNTFWDAFVTRFSFCGGLLDAHGGGCPGAAGWTPALGGAGCPTPGYSFIVQLEDALGGAPALLLLGAGEGKGSVTPVCSVAVLPLLPVAWPFILPGSGPGAGGFSLQATLPLGLAPAEVFLQVLVSDPNALFGVAASNALRVSISD